MKRKRALLVSCSVILLCMAIIVGMTYALFTDTVSVKNHLQAGDLNITLTRTNLEYSVLKEDGKLEVIKVEDDLGLTTSTAKNVFGIDSEDIRIVPGSYFDAELKITNGGNVAFDYNVGIDLVGDSVALAEQLQVTVTRADGSEESKPLSDMLNGYTIATGEMLVGQAPDIFSVRVEFIDDLDYNNQTPKPDPLMDNDDAQTQTVVFDLVVSAVQATD